MYRFIPTRVGNTALLRSNVSESPVHPHACGEYERCMRIWLKDNGSSPRVWGIRLLIELQIPLARFIPTRVGNTRGVLRVPSPAPVHPHACGEYIPLHGSRAVSSGSSPRVWGIRFPLTGSWTPIRFIPTRVGNTLQEDARNNRLLAELQRATEPCVLQACSDDDKKGKELCKAAPSPRKTLPGRAVTLSCCYMPR